MPRCAVLQSAYGDVKVRLELPPGVPLARTVSTAVDGGDGMQISTVSLPRYSVRSLVGCEHGLGMRAAACSCQLQTSVTSSQQHQNSSAM